MIKEADIEKGFIQKLVDLKYIYRDDIRDRDSLEKNFREKFNQLNRVNLTDSEFARLREEIITSDVFAASKKLREKHTFIREDDTPLQYTLVNIKDWCKNEFEVINQLRINTKNSNHRYDVIILINGIPVVQVELKGLAISPRRAMQQIIDYKNDVGNGYTNSLLCFMQLFIVSNQANTYYFSNNDNKHFRFNADEQFLPVYKMADINNKKIDNLLDFSDAFLPKCTLGEMIGRNMVMLESEKKILVMRPYQIYAVKALVDCIEQNRGNGYIWHTTGSGKTLTSFKASTLLKDNPNIEKCLFVVDRKDLDRQTREEFNKFQEGSVEENTNTKTLVKRLLSTDYADKVIVTTIQKLGLALGGDNKNKYQEELRPLKDKRIVFIFDECHRSQFGDNHKSIKDFFPNAQLFGFTGTPIFPDNASYTIREGEKGKYKTTEDIFENCLHAYTITHAIEDKNVLKFHIDHFHINGEENIPDKEKKAGIATYIIDNHNALTDQRRFNALFATASINDAIAYFRLFEKLQKERAEIDKKYEPLHIACVFSPPIHITSKDGEKTNGKNMADIKQLQGDLLQEKEDNKVDPEGKKQALIEIIADYNQQFNSNHTINEFDLYYPDIQSRIKDQKYKNSDYPYKNKLDIVIVVDMLLTGFDSKYLNTLYVDKNLSYHGLIQAFSRTNRVLNDTKPHGSIIDFRQQKDNVDDAIILFSEEGEEKSREIWFVDPAYMVIEKYGKAIDNFTKVLESFGLECKPEEINNLKGDAARAEFINSFKEVQRIKTQLDQYTDLTDDQKLEIEQLLPSNDLLSFRSGYLETAQRLKAGQQKKNKEEKEDAEVEQLDFELVLFASSIIDYDYIMSLLAEMTHSQGTEKQKMSKEQLISLLLANASLLDERDDIVEYINGLEMDKPLKEKEIKEGYQKFKEHKNQDKINSIAQKHGIKAETLQTFVAEIIHRMIFDAEKLYELMKPLELGWKARSLKETALMADLIPHLHKLAQGGEISGLNTYE